MEWPSRNRNDLNICRACNGLGVYYGGSGQHNSGMAKANSAVGVCGFDFGHLSVWPSRQFNFHLLSVLRMSVIVPLPSRNAWYITVACALAVTVCTSIVILLLWGNYLTDATSLTLRSHRLAGAQLHLSPKVIVSGSSHLWTDLDPRCMDTETVNLSHPSNDYTMMKCSTLFALDRAPSIRVAILELGIVPLFFDAIEQHGANGFLAMGIGPFELPLSMDKRIYAAIHATPFYSLPRITPSEIWMVANSQPPTSEIVPGFLVRPAGEYRDNAQERAVSQSRRQSQRGTYQRNRRALFELLDELEGRGVETFMVIPPAVDDYWEGISMIAAAELLNVRSQIEQYATVTVLDFSTGRVNGLLQSDFYDADHLNTVGAKKFTEQIASTIGDLADR